MNNYNNSHSNQRIKSDLGGSKLKNNEWNQKWRSSNIYHTKTLISATLLSSSLCHNPQVDYKSFPTIHPDPLARPFHGLGCSCMPHSSKSLVTFATPKLGLRNLLNVPTSNVSNYFLTRQCAYVFYCCKIKVPSNLPVISRKSVLKDVRVEEAMEKMVSEAMEERYSSELTSGKFYVSLVAKCKKEAIVTYNNMKAALSSTLIRFVGYVLFKVFNHLFMSVTVTEGQLEMIQKAAERNIPLIFVPLHRSHVDYLFVTWILFNREITAPIVAAGDNLRMPIFGWLLRGLGGFFIKRSLEKTKGKKDYVYRAILQTYVSRALQSGYNLEFFIEGGRTRTGKPCMPRGGLLSVVVDAFLSGTMDDALIVPIAINYDRILDGNFVREQLGQKKVPETFWRAVRAIIKVLCTNYGHSRVDFNQPFSLREFFQSSSSSIRDSLMSKKDAFESADSNVMCKSNSGHHRSLSSPLIYNNPVNGTLDVNGHCVLHPTWSNSSLWTEVSEEYKCFVRNLASHIVYDAEKCQAIMSTNAVAWLLSYVHRDGTTLQGLTSSLEDLIMELRARNRDTGFSGEPLHVAIHGVSMLGGSLVEVEGDLQCDDPTLVFVRPVTRPPNVIELNYYANSLAPFYALDGIVATSLVTMSDCDLWSYSDVSTDCTVRESKLVDRCKDLCSILRNEFLFVPPCASLEDRIQESIHGLVVSGLLQRVEIKRPRHQFYEEDEDDDLDGESKLDLDCSTFLLCPSPANLRRVSMVTKGLTPLIESYYVTTMKLGSLLAAPSDDREFVHGVQSAIQNLLNKGALVYGESVAADPIRNAVKCLESDGVLQSYSQDSCKIIFLNKEFESEQRLWSLLDRIDSYRI